MAYLYRLALCVVLLVASGFVTTASAFPATQTNTNECTVAPCPTQYSYNDAGGTGMWFPTIKSACDAVLARLMAANTAFNRVYKRPGCIHDIIRVSDGVVVQVDADSLSVQTRTAPLVPASYSCPADAMVSGNQCICVLPKVENSSHTGCVAPPAPNYCPKPGTDGGWWTGSGRNGAKTACSVDPRVPTGDPSLPGCRVAGDSTFSSGGNSGPQADSDGWTWGAQMAYTGEKCVPDPNADPSSPAPNDPKCIPPKVAGVVNGEHVCYTPAPGSPDSNKPSSSESKPKTTTSSNPDGSTTTTTSGSKTDCANGTCTTTTTHRTTTTSPTGTTSTPDVRTTTTTCQMGPGCGPIAPTTSSTTNTSTSPNGSTTTSTSTTTPTSGNTGGGGGGTSGSGSTGSTGDGDGDQGPSQFAGQCGAPPFCDGDAILCAIAAATHKQECNWRPGASSETALYDTAKTKTGDQTSGLPGNSTVSLGPASFNQTELLGAASGMQDLTITVMGQAIVLPLSDINPWLARLGMVLQAVTFLLCMRIVTRG